MAAWVRQLRCKRLSLWTSSHCDVQVQWMPLTSDHITSSEHWALTIVLRDDKTSSRTSEQLQTPVHSSIDHGRSTVTSAARPLAPFPVRTSRDLTSHCVTSLAVCVCVCGNIRMRLCREIPPPLLQGPLMRGSSLNGSIIRYTTFTVHAHNKKFYVQTQTQTRHGDRAVERIQRHHQKWSLII